MKQLKSITKEFLKSKSAEGRLALLRDIGKLNVNELDLNSIRKILNELGCEELSGGTGSQITFRHSDLKGVCNELGHFAIHIVHKGREKQSIRKRDYKKYLLPQLEKLVTEQKR